MTLQANGGNLTTENAATQASSVPPNGAVSDECGFVFQCIAVKQPVPSQAGVPPGGTMASGAPSGGATAPGTTKWMNIPLDNPDSVLGTKPPGGSPDPVDALMGLGLSRAWAEHLATPSPPRGSEALSSKERNELIRAASDKALRDLTDELMSSRRF
ncbi:MAG: hypothetical protein P4L33_06030 [Capsulimonadaceae bacterium]|nr:hypothetical protein [Capsulimonadaceae bacterium]